MDDDHLALLLNSNDRSLSNQTTPIYRQQREPLVNIHEDEMNNSLVRMTCLNDNVPKMQPKPHFDDIQLIRPSSATRQNSRTKQIDCAPHLTSRGNRNSTDNLIQSSIDVTLSPNSSPDDRGSKVNHQVRSPIAIPSRPKDNELGIVTIFGPEDNDKDDDDGWDFDHSKFKFLNIIVQIFFKTIFIRLRKSFTHTCGIVQTRSSITSAFHT